MSYGLSKLFDCSKLVKIWLILLFCWMVILMYFHMNIITPDMNDNKLTTQTINIKSGNNINIKRGNKYEINNKKRLNIINSLHHNGILYDDTIFISIASFNDPDCSSTIISAFENAANPDRIFIGIYQQINLDKYSDCLNISNINCPLHPLCHRIWQINIIRVTESQAYGPTHGRYNADKLYNNETFYMIIDSHTWFRQNWDDIILQLWYSIENDYACITHYPKPWDSMKRDMINWKKHPNGDSSILSYHICGSIYESSINKMPRNDGMCYLQIKNMSKPILVPFFAAGFSFIKSHFRINVPFDPHTKYLFHGEEFQFATRLWTNGYDLYSPQFDIIFHRYSSENAKRGVKTFTNKMFKIRDSSEKRVNYIWGLLDIRTPNDTNKANLIEIQKYSLGNKRRIDQYWKFAGIDPKKLKNTRFNISVYANDELIRVPWNPPYDGFDPVLTQK